MEMQMYVHHLLPEYWNSRLKALCSKYETLLGLMLEHLVFSVQGVEHYQYKGFFNHTVLVRKSVPVGCALFDCTNLQEKCNVT